MSVTVLTRRRVLRGVLTWATALPVAAWVSGRPSFASALPPVEVWKDPNCRCCDGWVRHMRKAGFDVTVRISDDMAAIKQARGVPENMRSCHTAVVDGYVIEGHVPARDIMKLLGERPRARGLAVPGLPASAPGMDQPGQPYTAILFSAPSGNRPYAQHIGREAPDAL